MAPASTSSMLALHHIAIPASTKSFYQTIFALPSVRQNVNYTGWLALGGAQLHCISGGSGLGRARLEVTLARNSFDGAVERLKRHGGYLSHTHDGSVLGVDPVGTQVHLRVRDETESEAARAHEIEITRIVQRSTDVASAERFLGDTLGITRSDEGPNTFVISGVVPGARCVLELVRASAADARATPTGRGLFDSHVCLHQPSRGDLVARLQALRNAHADFGGAGSQWFAVAPDEHVIELSDSTHEQLKSALQRAHAAAARASAPPLGISDTEVPTAGARTEPPAPARSCAMDGKSDEEEADPPAAAFFDAVETNADGAHAAAGARVVSVDVFADPICPWVAMTTRVLRAVMRELPSSVRLEVCFRAFVLDERLPRFPHATTKRARYTAKRGRPVFTWADRTTAAIEAFNALPEARVAFTVEGGISSSVDCLRLLQLAAREGGGALQLELMEQLVRAFHEHGRNLGEPAVLEEAARHAGMGADVRAFLTSEEGVAEVGQETRAAVAAGVRGVPTLVWRRARTAQADADADADPVFVDECTPSKVTGSLSGADMRALVASLAATTGTPTGEH